ncbi:DNA alkylation repair protein, partial [Bacteroides sp. OttesenSCG-928-N06]|nr:DNA alkylation repair protein [Bacteroides sp. OttesenSCG-928-N06]
MAEPFKNMYNEQFLDRFTKDLKLVIPNLDARAFVSQTMDNEWENRELKQRTAHIATVLKQFLPADYKEAIAKILELLDCIEHRYPHCSKIDDTKFGLLLEYGGILDSYIEQYGLDDYETSVKAIERITQFTSCEFVTHPFIVRYPDAMMAQMLVWSKHE